MPEPAATRTIAYWPALAPGVAQVQVAQFIAAEGADEVVVVVGRSRQRWSRAQADRVLAAFRQAGYPLEASVQAGMCSLVWSGLSRSLREPIPG